MSMGRRDRLSNEIYQRMKQLQSRLNKRNAEEKRRQEKAEKAKHVLWEEHQRQLAQFENYLKQLTPSPSRRPKSHGARLERMDVDGHKGYDLNEHDADSTAAPLTPADIILKETTPSSISTKSKTSTPLFSTVKEELLLPEPELQSEFSPMPSPAKSPSTSTSADIEKSSLAKGLEDLETLKAPTPASPGSLVYSPDLSPLPSLPSTPSQYEPDPPPADTVETPFVQFDVTQVTPEPSLPSLSITKLTTSTPDILEPKQPSPAPPSPKPAPKKKKKKAPKVKKLTRRASEKMESRAAKDEERKEVLSKKQAQIKIKEIFKNVNSLPEEELTMETFDLFLDNIKQLSEYVDEVDSERFEVLDDISSGFSSRVMDMVQDDYTLSEGHATPGGISPNKMFENQVDRSDAQRRRLLAEEKRMNRIIVVREKQGEIIRYRKITRAELRLRRQRALMRMRQKISEDAREQREQERQKLRLFEMAGLAEMDRKRKEEDYRIEEEERMREEAEKKRLKELRVKEELEGLLDKSRKNRLEDQDRMKRARECIADEEVTEENDEMKGAIEKQFLKEFQTTQKITKQWKKTASKVKNKEKFDAMLKSNSWALYRNLFKELFLYEQQAHISDIPGFSYFLLLKLNDLNSAEVEELMLDI